MMQLMCRKLFLDPQNYLAQNVNSAEVEKPCLGINISSASISFSTYLKENSLEPSLELP